jgi:hypothetical protein
MKFLEFTQKNTGRKDYFVGSSYQDILSDTRDGTSFGGVEYESFRSVQKSEVVKLKFKYFSSGVRAVQGGCQSYALKLS